MQIDARISKLAKNILKNSVQLQKGEKIYIEAFGASTKDFFNELIKVHNFHSILNIYSK